MEDLKRLIASKKAEIKKNKERKTKSGKPWQEEPEKEKKPKIEKREDRDLIKKRSYTDFVMDKIKKEVEEQASKIKARYILVI